MKSWMVVLMAVAALVAAGCAKGNVVKKDEAIVPAAAVQTAPGASAAKEAPAAARPVDVTTSAAKPAAATNAAADAGAQSAGSSQKGSAAGLAKDELKAALERIYFDFDSAALTRKDRDILSKNMELLKKAAGAKVTIAGHCDERGSDDYNLALGEKRARAAKQYLVTLGIPAERLSVISYGKEKPVDPGHDEGAWAKNRRDDFVVQ